MRNRWIGLIMATVMWGVVAVVPTYATEGQPETTQETIITEVTDQNLKSTEDIGNQDGANDIEDIISVTGVKLNIEAFTFSELSEKKTLTATIEPFDAVNQNVTWISDDTSVATVTDQGVVTPIANGSTVIWVVTEDGGKSAGCEVIVDLYNGVCQSVDGKWYYYKDGIVDTTYTGFASNENGDWYLEGGKVNFNKNGVIQDKTGALGTKGTWYNVVKSEVDFTYTGFASNENGDWYLEDGKVNFNKNGVIQDKTGALGTKGTWYNVVKGKVELTYTGFASNENGDWYLEDGKVKFNKNGVIQDKAGVLGTKGTWYYVVNSQVKYVNTVAKNENGWWKITNGKVDFYYTGFASNGNGDWYLEGGKVKFNKNGVIQDKTGALGTKGTWYYVVNSQVKYVNTVAKNENGWWKITNGRVDFSYTGFASNEKGDWYVEGGKVKFNKNSVIQDKTGTLGTKGVWYYTVESQVRYVDTVAKNENGWWYIKGGKVDFSFTGIAKNSNGYWYIQKGQVNFKYNGTVTYNGQTWKVVNGKATASESIKYKKVTDSSSPLYGKTLKLYYDKNGNLIQDVTSMYTGSRTYEIYVNKTKNMVTVYTKDGDYYVPVKCFVCSTGGSGTPEGTFYTPNKYRWHELMGPCWGQWCTRINGGVLFHSVFYNSYNNNNALSVSAYNKLGVTASHGCVRLTAGDAKWIYDNCALKTKVVIYSSSGYEPLTKPSAYKLSSSHTWDPTDPNMYYKCQQRGCH